MSSTPSSAGAVNGSSITPRPWRSSLLALTALLALILIVYRDTARTMVATWSSSETFAHAYLVLPISLWLIWRRRASLVATLPRAEPWWLLALVVVVLIWTLGDLAVVNALTQFAMVALLVIAVPAVLGWSVTRQILFPLGFLFFAVPFGEFMQPKMMDWTADFAVAALRLSGVPVYREGLQFVIPTGTWSVVEACSGVRYLIASLMVGTLFGYLTYQSNVRRWIFAGVSIVVPIVANWLRAYFIVMLGHLSGNKLAVGVDHLIYGWVFFGVVILIMFAIGARWSEPEAVVPGSGGAARLSSAPTIVTGDSTRTWLVLAGAALAILAPQAIEHRIGVDVVRETPRLQAVVVEGSQWAAANGSPVFSPSVRGAAAVEHREFLREDVRVGVFVAYFRGQSYDQKLVSSENRLVRADDDRWNHIASSTEIDRVGDEQVQFMVHRFGDRAAMGSGSQLLVRQTYWIGGRWIAHPVMAKWFGVVQRLSGRGDDGAFVVVYAIGRNQDRTRDLLRDFARESGPRLRSVLEGAYAPN